MSVRKFPGVPHARSYMRQEGLVPREIECPKSKFATIELARKWAKERGFATKVAEERDDAFVFAQSRGKVYEDVDLDAVQVIEFDGVRALVEERGDAPDVKEWRDVFTEDEGELRYADFEMHARALSPAEVAKVRAARRAAGDDSEDKGASKKLYEVSIASEAEVERWFGIEILGHDAGEIDTTRADRGMAVLVDHRGDQVGVVKPGTFRVDDDKVSRAYVRFSRSQRGREVEQDVEDEIRQNSSVGYFVSDAKLVETRKVGEDSSGRAMTIDVWRVTRWQPAEWSSVSVPADVTVGPGRSTGASRETEEEPAAPVVTSKEERTMKKKFVRGDGGAVIEVDEADGRLALTDSERITILADERAATREAQIQEIEDLCEGHNVTVDERRAWIKERKSPDEVARILLKKKRTEVDAPQPGAESLDGLNENDRKRYSITRAILKAAAQREGTGKFDGVEAEVHQEIDRRLASNIKRNGGIFIPVDMRSQAQRIRAMEKRALDSKTAGKGAELIHEEQGELIEILRQSSVAARLGARIITGLSAPISFPKHNGRLQAYWVGENPPADVTDSDLGFGQVNLVAKTIQASTAFSRQWLAQSGIDGEGLVKSELGTEHSLLWDRTAFHGEGTAGEPTGVYKAPDVKVKAVGGLPSYAHVVDSIGLIADANALDGTLGWVTTPLMAAKLKQIPEHATAQMANWLWQGTVHDGTMGGYRALSSNQISKIMTGSEDTGGAEQGAIFGNWADLLIGMFLGLEIIVDPFAKKKRGLIEVTSIQMVDEILRHGESFTKWTGATLV